MLKRIFPYLQYLIPQHLLTQAIGRLADSQIPWLKNLLIKSFIKRYKINMQEAQQENVKDYLSFNQFFIRQLKPELRPIAIGENTVIMPADGTIAEIGNINKNLLIQAKNFYYDLNNLFGGDQDIAQRYENGKFATIYLAPSNYHRVHMPCTGKLKQTIYIPGKLFSVNNMTSQIIPNLYSRNERLIAIFDTNAGEMAVILVGALIVGGIKAVWQAAPVRDKEMRVETFSQSIELQQGAELGYFNLGSTVIVLFQPHKIDWASNLCANSLTQFGQVLGKINSPLR